ncbi:hypothetical protein [Bordetella sp. FB-8]|nr:hypothetical protein [Bordetella sp. FB-8]
MWISPDLYLDEMARWRLFFFGNDGGTDNCRRAAGCEPQAFNLAW